MANQAINDRTEATSIATTDTLPAYVAGASAGRKITAATLLNSGANTFMGVQAIGALTFDDTTHILSAATITYWFEGVVYTSASPVTCDIDSFETLTTNTTYYFYFDDSTGTMKCADTAWNLKTNVPVATVFWNGTEGAIVYEAHNHTRDLDWHMWAHETVGTRYDSGLSLTYPDAANDDSLQIESGELHDEDIEITIAQQTTSRVLYQASSGVYTWEDSSLPYAGTTGVPKFCDTDSYTLETFANNNYINYWIYGTNDTERNIYIIPTHAADAYGNLNAARAESPPTLIGLNVNSEMKLLYRFIYSGNGEFVESEDYRNSSSLPAGGTASTTAAAVSFNAYGDISATTVQGAIEELDDEKISAVSNDTVAANTTWGDSYRAQFGTSGDLSLYHNGSHSYISNMTGNLDFLVNSNELAIQTVPNGAVSLYYDNSKKFETTNTGIDISGVVTTSDGTAGSPAYSFLSDGNSGIYSPGSDTLGFVTGASEAMRIDSNGNVGIGKSSLESWASGYTALQIGGNASLFSTTTEGTGAIFSIMNNAYFDGDYKYIAPDEASRYFQINGNHYFSVAGSGTADTSISWTPAMTINNDGTTDFGGNIAITGALSQTGNGIIIGASQTPDSATSTGTTGTVAWDDDYIYVCTSTDNWKRSALSTWP